MVVVVVACFKRAFSIGMERRGEIVKGKYLTMAATVKMMECNADGSRVWEMQRQRKDK